MSPKAPFFRYLLSIQILRNTLINAVTSFDHRVNESHHLVVVIASNQKSCGRAKQALSSLEPLPETPFFVKVKKFESAWVPLKKSSVWFL